jgi:hypothetical protein
MAAVTVSFMLHVLLVLIACGIVWLIGNWVLAQLGLGEPWPRVLMLLLAMVLIAGVVAPLLGVGRLWPVGAP